MELVICALIFILIIVLYDNKREKKNHETVRKAYLEQIEKLNEKIKKTELERDYSKKQAASYDQKIQKLTEELEEVKAKLEFYSNIEEASSNLNVSQDVEAEKQLLEEAAQQIKTARAHQINLANRCDSGSDAIESLLDEEQAFACVEMEHTQDNFFITGKAGTGKSFLLDVFRNTTEKNILF